MASVGELRRSQLITTFGIGSVVDLPHYSAMVLGQPFWDEAKLEVVREERLEKSVGLQGFSIDEFRIPKISENYGDTSVSCVRFPEWVFCGKCRKIAHYDTFGSYNERNCRACSRPRAKHPLVPARFVVACSKGHIDDFPWEWWCHRGTLCDRPQLRLSDTGRSTALSSIWVRCTNCGATRPLEGIFGKDVLQTHGCTGRRPWLKDSEPCSETPWVLQRGASNLYFASLKSAISIPPFSEAVHLLLSRYEPVLRVTPREILPLVLEPYIRQSGCSLTVEEAVRALDYRAAFADSDAMPDIRKDEYLALVSGDSGDPHSEFWAVQEEVPSELTPFFSRVVSVKRLREVCALLGFTRVDPHSEVAAPLSSRAEKWLPAVETRGEGIFLELNAGGLTAWLTRHGAQLTQRADKIENHRSRLHAGGKWRDDRPAHPVFVLAHTLAHLFIRQLTLDCGYSSSALRERLYFGLSESGEVEMAGLLVYTATSDSEGSLGGLVRQAQKERFQEVLYRTVEQCGWCSNDPLCQESLQQGMDSLNLAACHACTLLPETACELRNCLLDRAMLLGVTANPGIGFFDDLVEKR